MRATKKNTPALFTPVHGGGYRAAEFQEVPRQRGVRTSEAAAEAVKPRLAGQLAQVLAAFRTAAHRGLTDEEGEEQTGLPGNSFRPRRRSLETGGFITRTATTRATRSGGSATVFIAAEFVGATP